LALTVLILTKNEAANIVPCIRSVLFADQILVIDSGSEDNTSVLATELGAKVVIHPMDDGFAAQRNFALAQAETEWVMFLDADERISPELAAEIQTVIGDAPYAYEIPRKNHAFGQWLRYGGNYPDYSLRLYPRDAIAWSGVVHETATVTLAVKQLKNAIIHYTYTDWDRYFIKFNHYTSLFAKERNEAGRKASWSDIMIRPPWAFIRMYILKKGFLDGKIGFVMAVFHYFYTMAKYVKLFYLQKQTSSRPLNKL
jgi:glycosyltransferase involved in cell wall biosynthesis